MDLSKIQSVKELSSTYSANSHLAAGWKLLSATATVGQQVLYIVGLEEGTELPPYSSGDPKSDALAEFVKQRSAEIEAEEIIASQSIQESS